jgi:hypothetical protein
MDPQSLAIARDLALILLILEAAVLALPLLIIPFYIIRYLPRVKAPIRPNLRKIRLCSRSSGRQPQLRHLEEACNTSRDGGEP